MGDLFRNQQSSQSTSNQQVGVQGGTGVGAGASAAGAGSTGAVLNNVNAGGPINITTSDIEALHLVDNTTRAALESNTAVTTQATNASYLIATNALATLQEIHGTDAVTTNNALQGAIGIAATAAPQSPGATAELLGAQDNKSTYVAIAGAVIVGLIYLWSQKRK